MNQPILVVGKKETILGFKSIGLATLFWNDQKEDITELENYIAKETKIIFFTEDIAEDIQYLQQKYQHYVYPIFVVIPSLGQSQTKGKEYIQNLVVQALGSTSFDKK